MANGQGIHNLTVQEAQNVQLGQCRSALIDDGDAYAVNDNEVIVAIQIIQDVKFDTLTPEDPDNCWGDSTVGLGNSGGTGDDVVNTTVFVAGICLYGRWTNIELVQGVVVLYMIAK